MPEKLLDWVIGGALTIIGYFVRDLHIRFEKHLDDNQKAHEEMRSAMSQARVDAKAVEERQDALKEQLTEMKVVLTELRTAVLVLPQTIARVVCDPRHNKDGL